MGGGICHGVKGQEKTRHLEGRESTGLFLEGQRATAAPPTSQPCRKNWKELDRRDGSPRVESVG